MIEMALLDQLLRHVIMIRVERVSYCGREYGDRAVDRKNVKLMFRSVTTADHRTVRKCEFLTVAFLGRINRCPQRPKLNCDKT